MKTLFISTLLLSFLAVPALSNDRLDNLEELTKADAEKKYSEYLEVLGTRRAAQIARLRTFYNHSLPARERIDILHVFQSSLPSGQNVFRERIVILANVERDALVQSTGPAESLPSQVLGLPTPPAASLPLDDDGDRDWEIIPEFVETISA